MSLADRLEQARRSPQIPQNGHESPAGANHSAARIRDPFASVKASVHQALLESLGPQLYDPHLEQSDRIPYPRVIAQLGILGGRAGRAEAKCERDDEWPSRHVSLSLGMWELRQYPLGGLARGKPALTIRE